MKLNLFLFISLIANIALFAQEAPPVYNNGEHSLVEDHIFEKVQDLYGYTFIPHQGKLDFAHYPDPVPPGWVRFTINKNTIKILERTEYRPGGIQVLPNRKKEYTLQITGIEDNKTSIIFKLADPLAPDMPGTLYLQKDGLSRITMLKYLPGPGDHERIYIIKYAEKEELAADQEYFTHQEDYKTDIDTVFWGKTLYPFESYENYYNNNKIIIKRIRPDDGYNINFFTKKVLNKRNKETVVKYISFVENSKKILQLVFKKSTIVRANHKDGNRKTLELECFDEITKEPYYIVMHRGALSYLKSIEVQLLKNKQRKTLMYYTMRKGKGKLSTIAAEVETKEELVKNTATNKVENNEEATPKKEKDTK